MSEHTFSDQEFSNKKALWPFLKRISTYALAYPRWVVGFVFWIIIVALVDALFPLMLLWTIDGALVPELEKIKAAADAQQAYTPDLSTLYGYGIFFLGLILVQILGVFLFIKYTGNLREFVMTDLRKAMFQKLQKLPFAYYDRSASGWLLTRLTSDTDRVTEVISWGLVGVTWGMSMLVFCVLTLIYYNWQLGLVVLCCLPLILLLSVRIRMLVLQYSRKARKINSDLTASYSEHINGLRVNKSTAQEKRVTKEFGKLNETMFSASYKASWYTAMYFPIILFVGSIASSIAVLWGGNMVLSGAYGLSLGAWIAAIDYARRVFMPTMDIAAFYAQAQGSLSAGERIFSLLDEPLPIQDGANATDFDTIKGAIDFENIGFHYVEGQPVLRDFNLKIEAGQSIALVGATGEGKSTIANLVARFYEPTAGSLKIDGQDYSTKTLHSLRSQIGVVLQTPHLFSGTIKANICYGKKEASDTEIKRALELVGATEFIERLNEDVGEEGQNLSMGERQLLSFARAVLIDPAIFIMDEATSSIDTLTEAKIQHSIQQILEGRTSIIIAHRLSTIKNCDRILVIKKGGILEDGSHKKLMEAKGKYYELYTKQLRSEKLQVATTD